MLDFILSILAAIGVFFGGRSDTALEVLALREQVAVLKRKRPRPPLNSLDRLFWTTLRRVWSRWTDVLVIVKPGTVVGWRRAGFRLYWRWRCHPRGGRPTITDEIGGLIRRLAQENPDWGAPKIHGELFKLAFVVSERTVARYLRRVRRRGDSGKRWLAFLRNHREVIALEERHLLRLVRDCVSYYHQDRIHDSLDKDTPDRRPVEPKPAAKETVISMPRLGGPHHRYAWLKAA